MRCPECHGFPFRLLKIRLFGGLRFSDYIRGYIACAHCGAILKVLGYDRPFWYIFPAFLVLVTAVMIALDLILENREAFVWIAPLAAIVIGFGIGFIVSRFTRVEKAAYQSG